MKLYTEWKKWNEEAIRLDMPTRSFVAFAFQRMHLINIIAGSVVGLIIVFFIITTYYQITTHRTRGGLPCNQWIAECTFHNDLKTCIVKAYELGCPVERIP